MLDEEDITYSTQNFSKHYMATNLYVPTFSTSGFSTNPSNVLTLAAASVIKTYKTFSMEGTETLSLDLEGAFSWQSGGTIPNNTIIEFGFGLTANTTPFDCFDGAYLRATNAGVVGVLRNNSSTDTTTSGVFNDYTGAAWVPVNGRKYQFIIYLMTRSVEFWVNDPVADSIWLAAEIGTPAGYGAPIASQAVPVWLRQYQATAPTIGAQFTLSRYNVRRGGTNISTTLNVLSNRAGESIWQPGNLIVSARGTQSQALTSGSITRPAAAVPTNAGPGINGLGCIYVETGTLAIGTDAILMSFQAPALPTATGATYEQNRRLRIDGVSIASGVTVAFATGGFQKHFYLAYGSTSVSLAGVATDTATTKAYRRLHLPIVQYYTATHAPGAPNGAATYYAFQTPVFVNPGEWVALATYHQGTVGTTGVITHAIQLDAAWE
jgi:hypothetical protein